MHIDMIYIYMHKKNYVPRKIKRLIIWDGGIKYYLNIMASRYADQIDTAKLR